MALKTAAVIGSGPNGLTAAILMARAGVPTTVYEAQPTIGGGTRSAELTLPGVIHDVCSAVHPLALSSPVFQTFPLAEYGLEWIQPPVPLAHPFDDGTSALLRRSVAETAQGLGLDRAAYVRAVGPLADRWMDLAKQILAPVAWPASPYLLARFGVLAPWPAASVARSLFRTDEARALFAGCAAHSFLPLENLVSAAFGWVLALSAHGVGWPIPRGGSQSIADALAGYFRSLGGRIVTGTPVTSLEQLGDASMILCDVTPRQLVAIAGKALPPHYRGKLERYRYGPGIFKADWALSAPVPWKSADCARSATVHLGGKLEEIAASERAAWEGRACDRPFVLFVQPSLFDASRAAAGKHTAWAYCHVPNGSTRDMTEIIENQVERFAPGFRDTILARSSMSCAEMERRNANLVGGDINGGAQDLPQLFLRPTPDLYRTPVRGLYLCSSSTPPGGAVHGMCGYFAATMALRDARVIR